MMVERHTWIIVTLKTHLDHSYSTPSEVNSPPFQVLRHSATLLSTLSQKDTYRDSPPPRSTLSQKDTYRDSPSLGETF